MQLRGETVLLIGEAIVILNNLSPFVAERHSETSVLDSVSQPHRDRTYVCRHSILREVADAFVVSNESDATDVWKDLDRVHSEVVKFIDRCPHQQHKVIEAVASWHWC
jgi:hypothetical protein